MAPASSSPALSRSRWANLADGPAGLIAERLLASDVAEYIRFRAVCGSWRMSCADRRFHPRRWILLLESHAAPDSRRFLNLSTGECIQACLPELRDHMVLAQTSEGLLVLLHHDRTRVRLLNPLTGRLTELPPLTTVLPKKKRDHHLLHSPASDLYFGAWGSGVLDDDDFTVVLSFNSLDMVGLAKPGDACWTALRFHNRLRTASAMFAGRFYGVTDRAVMVLKDQPWQLEVAAKLHIVRVAPMEDSVHLVESAGELMLVHGRFSRSKRRYDVYRVDFDSGTLRRVHSLGDGGHALFLGMRCSLSVPIGVFPAGSICGDTINLRFDVDGRDPSCRQTHHTSCDLDCRLVAQQPHTHH